MIKYLRNTWVGWVGLIVSFSLLLSQSPLHSQPKDQGIFSRFDCTAIPQPIAYETYCLNTGSGGTLVRGLLYYWDGVNWVCPYGCVFVRVYHSVDQSISNESFQYLEFNSERWDTHAMHSTGSPDNQKITITTSAGAGVYLITMAGRYTENSTGSRGFFLELNGTTEIGRQYQPAVLSAQGGTALTVTTTYDLAVNDFIKVYAFQGSGGALSVTASANFSPEFTIQKIGRRS